MRRLLALLVAALLVPLAAAQAPNAQDLADGTVQKSKGLVDKALDGLGGAAKGAGKAASAAGDGLGSAASAVAQFFAKVAAALTEGTAAAVSMLAGTGAAAADLAANSALAAVTASLQALGAVGRGLAVAATFAAGTLAQAAAAVGAALQEAASAVAGLVAGVAAAYLSFVGGLRPRGMDARIFAGIAATGAAASTAAAGYGLWSIVRRFGWMLGGTALAGFSRIEDSELLQHPMRAQLFAIVQARPGIHASELTRRAGAGWGTIVHHLDKLERAKLLTVRNVNHQKCYFESGGKVSRQDMQVASAVRSDSAAQIAAFVAAHPMTNQKAMAAQLGISPALASFHVKKLVVFGVLDKVRQGKATLLTTTDSLRRVMGSEAPAQIAVAVAT